MSPVAYNFISSPQGGEDAVPLRFAQIREYGMPLPLFTIEIRMAGSDQRVTFGRSGKSGSEGETAEIRSTLTPTLSRQREREIII